MEPSSAVVCPTQGASILYVRIGSNDDGLPFVITAGLSNRMQAWSCLDGEWTSVLTVQNSVQLANGRSTSHPFRCLTEIQNNMFAIASNQPDSLITVYCSRQWVALQALQPDEHNAMERCTPSCLELRGRYLACGSREGAVVLWRFDDENRRFVPCWDSGLARADAGPVAAVSIDETAGLLVVAYRQLVGSVDGAPYEGSQSVAAWELDADHPRVVWAVSLTGLADATDSPLTHPATLALLVSADALWLLHAHSGFADGEWPQQQPPPRADETQERQTVSDQIVLRGSLPRFRAPPEPPSTCWTHVESLGGTPASNGGTHAEGLGGTPPSDGSTSEAPTSSRRAVLAWTASPDGTAMGIGFAGGGVALLHATSAVVYWGSATTCVADVGAVALTPAPAGSTQLPRSPTLPMVLTGTAARFLQLWAAREDGSLQLVRVVSTPMQPSALVTAADGFFCGAADGRVGYWAWHALWDDEALPWPTAAAAPNSDTTATATGQSTCYDWHFSMGGRAAAARVCERRGAFNGWARTADYERGLLDLLLGRSAPSSGGGDRAHGAGAPRRHHGDMVDCRAQSERRHLSDAPNGPASKKGAGVISLSRAASADVASWLWSRFAAPSARRPRHCWPSYRSGALPPPEVAVCSRIVRVRRLLSADDVADVLRLSEELPFARKHRGSARATCYISGGGAFASRLPHLRTRLLATARAVDARQGWNLLAERTVVPRCVECHTLGPGKDVLHPGHYDFGSVLTIDVMLSAAGEFAGGAFQTIEAGGQRRRTHAFGCGDALVFVSHKPHFVSEVSSGERRVLIMELWEGEERACPHRCEVRQGACLASVRDRL